MVVLSKCAKNFLDPYLPTDLGADPLPIKVQKGSVHKKEAAAQAVHWAMEYLYTRFCPNELLSLILKGVRIEVNEKVTPEFSKSDFVDSNGNGSATEGLEMEPLKLMRSVVKSVDEIIAKFKGLGIDINLEERFPELCGKHMNDEELTMGKLKIFSFSYHSFKNQRRTQEDKVVVLPNLDVVFDLEKKMSYFAVLDGHNGLEAAAYGAAQLHNNLIESLPHFNDAALAIADAYKKTDLAFLQKCKTEKIRSGATVVAALIDNQTIYISWVGDCGAVLCYRKQEETVAQQLVNSHLPSRQSEEERVKRMGGEILTIKEMPRVNGTLAVTRSLGDADFKGCVISAPEILTIDAKKIQSDFLILGSDGLFDAMSAHDVQLSVEQSILNDESANAAQRLASEAKEKGSEDNTSVIVLYFRSLEELKIEIETRHSNGSAAYKEIEEPNSDLGNIIDTHDPATESHNGMSLENDNLASAKTLLDLDSNAVDSDSSQPDDDWQYQPMTVETPTEMKSQNDQFGNNTETSTLMESESLVDFSTPFVTAERSSDSNTTLLGGMTPMELIGTSSEDDVQVHMYPKDLDLKESTVIIPEPSRILLLDEAPKVNEEQVDVISNQECNNVGLHELDQVLGVGSEAENANLAFGELDDMICESDVGSSQALAVENLTEIKTENENKHELLELNMEHVTSTDIVSEPLLDITTPLVTYSIEVQSENAIEQNITESSTVESEPLLDFTIPPVADSIEAQSEKEINQNVAVSAVTESECLVDFSIPLVADDNSGEIVSNGMPANELIAGSDNENANQVVGPGISQDSNILQVEIIPGPPILLVEAPKVDGNQVAIINNTECIAVQASSSTKVSATGKSTNKEKDKKKEVAEKKIPPKVISKPTVKPMITKAAVAPKATASLANARPLPKKPVSGPGSAVPPGSITSAAALAKAKPLGSGSGVRSTTGTGAGLPSKAPLRKPITSPSARGTSSATANVLGSKSRPITTASATMMSARPVTASPYLASARVAVKKAETTIAKLGLASNVGKTAPGSGSVPRTKPLAANAKPLAKAPVVTKARPATATASLPGKSAVGGKPSAAGAGKPVTTTTTRVSPTRPLVASARPRPPTTTTTRTVGNKPASSTASKMKAASLAKSPSASTATTNGEKSGTPSTKTKTEHLEQSPSAPTATTNGNNNAGDT